MPIPVQLKKRKISLTNKNRLLINYYRTALESEQVRSSTVQQEPAGAAAVGEVKQQKGLWARYVTSTVENICGIAMGATFIELPAVELELDAPAEMLLRDYTGFLNSMLIQQGLNSEDTEKEPIDSRFALVREILYRLVTVALSNKLDHEHDGNRLLEALDTFIKSIASEEILLEGERMTPFMVALSTEHAKWIVLVKQMVEMVQLINGHRKAISDTLSQLKQAEQIIQCQLIAFLDPSQKPSGFAPEWLDKTLSICEKKYLESSNTSKGSALAIQDNSSDLIKRQATIISELEKQKKHISVVKKISSLYRLQQRGNMLYALMSHLDLLITYTSWMPILTGKFNFSRLSALMENYRQQCKTVLEIPQELSNIHNMPAGRGMMKYGAAVGLHLKLVLQPVNLAQLDDPILRQRIGGMVNAALTALVTMQANFEPEYHFIEGLNVVESLGQDSPSSGARNLSLTEVSSPSVRPSVVTKPPSSPIVKVSSQLSLSSEKVTLISTSYTKITTATAGGPADEDDYSERELRALLRCAAKGQAFITVLTAPRLDLLKSIVSECMEQLEANRTLIIPIQVSTVQRHFTLLHLNPSSQTVTYFDPWADTESRDSSTIKSLLNTAPPLDSYKLLFESGSSAKGKQENKDSQIHILYWVHMLYSENSSFSDFNYDVEYQRQDSLLIEINNGIKQIKTLGLNNDNVNKHRKIFTELEKTALPYYDESLWYYLGVLNYQDRNIDKALQYFNNIKNNFLPTEVESVVYANVLLYRALCSFSLKKLQVATEQFSEVIRFCSDICRLAGNNDLRQISEKAQQHLSNVRQQREQQAQSISSLEGVSATFVR